MNPKLIMTHTPDNKPTNLTLEIVDSWVVYTMLTSSEIWYLDTETYPFNWTKEDAEKEYRSKVKTFSEKNFEKYYDSQRSERALDPRRNTIRLAQIHIKDYVIILDTYHDYELATNVFELIPEKLISGTNVKFDLTTIYKFMGKRLIPKEIYDVSIGHLLMMFQRETVKHRIKSSYKEICKFYFDIDLSKENQAADWGGDLTSDMIYYAFTDVVYLPKILSSQAKWINKNSARSIITPYFKIVFDFITKLEMEFIKV